MASISSLIRVDESRRLAMGYVSGFGWRAGGLVPAQPRELLLRDVADQFGEFRRPLHEGADLAHPAQLHDGFLADEVWP